MSAPSASAGALLTTGTPYNDGFVTWKGSAPYVEGDLNGYVEWAVYATGQFPFTGYTPTASEFTYAYQIFEVGISPVSSFAVTLTAPADNIGTSNTAPFLPGDSPFLSTLVSSVSAIWRFTDIAAGENSIGLMYSSPRPPEFGFGTVVDTGQSQFVLNIARPSNPPIPEPGSAFLLLAASVGGSLARWRRRTVSISTCHAGEAQV